MAILKTSNHVYFVREREGEVRQKEVFTPSFYSWRNSYFFTNKAHYKYAASPKHHFISNTLKGLLNENYQLKSRDLNLALINTSTHHVHESVTK